MQIEEIRPGISPAGWALRFVSSLPGVAVAISGMSKLTDVVDNVNTFKDFKPLSEDGMKVYYEICEKYQGKNLIPCTGCEYCIPCKESVSIPEVFGLVNTFRIEGRLGPEGDGAGMKPADRRQFLTMYNNKIGQKHNAARCSACEECIPKCPQHVKVTGEMKKVNELVERIRKGGRA